jgi:hypothetical protein
MSEMKKVSITLNMKTVSIQLYEKKIAWAETQVPHESPSKDKMLCAIGHVWDGKACPYCQNYVYENINNCNLCPLYDITYKKNRINASEYCCSGLWTKMNESKTWAEWIINAEKVLEYIKEHG